MKWVRQVQWEYLVLKERWVTLGVQECLLQAFLERKASQDPRGDQDPQVLQVPREELLKVTFLTLAHVEIKDLLDLTAQEERLDLQDPVGVLTF